MEKAIPLSGLKNNSFFALPDFFFKKLPEDTMKLEREFYLREDVVGIARDLLGKVLMSKIDGRLCGGIITETEAYAGVLDRASHAYGGRRTERTEIMYREGGTAYIYLCYGVHSLFNVVTNSAEIPHAVLIRALFPTVGLEAMRQRRKKSDLISGKLCIGPGTVSQALGFHYSHTGTSLLGASIWIEDNGLRFSPEKILTGPRIGVAYAGKDAHLPYRFRIPHNSPEF